MNERNENVKIRISKQIENIKFHQNFIFIYFFESISKIIFPIEYSIKNSVRILLIKIC